MFTSQAPGPNRTGAKVDMEGADRLAKRRVLIVDDHAVVRAGFKQLIDGTEDIGGRCGGGHRGGGGAGIAVPVDCDVVLLDISLPDASVLETGARCCRRRRPTLPILIVSMHPEEQYAVNLLRAGASGFFQGAAKPGTCSSRSARVSGGRKYISALARRGAGARGHGQRARAGAPPARTANFTVFSAACAAARP